MSGEKTRKCDTLAKLFQAVRSRIKPHILWRDGFVAFDSLQSAKETNTRIVIPAVATIWVVLRDVFCSCV